MVFWDLLLIMIMLLSSTTASSIVRLPLCESSKFDQSVTFVACPGNTAHIYYLDKRDNQFSRTGVDDERFSDDTQIMPFSFNGRFFLANNSANKQDDIVLDAKTFAKYVLHRKNCSPLAETPEYLYFASWENKTVTIVQLCISDGNMVNIDTLASSELLHISPSSYFNDQNLLVWSYCDPSGTWICKTTGDDLLKYKLSDTLMYDVAILPGKDSNMRMYKGYDITDSECIFNPELLTAKFSDSSYQITSRHQLDARKPALLSRLCSWLPNNLSLQFDSDLLVFDYQQGHFGFLFTSIPMDFSCINYKKDYWAYHESNRDYSKSPFVVSLLNSQI